MSAMCKSLVILLLLAASMVAGAAADEKAVSAAAAMKPRLKGDRLVAVGVNKYDDPRLAALKFAATDAEDVCSFFVSSGMVSGGDALLLVSDARSAQARPTRNNILAALTEAARQAEPDSTIFFSFSGHGFSATDGNESYLFPEDGNLALLAETAVPLSRVESLLRSSRAARKVLLVDACRNSPLSAGRSIGVAAASTSATAFVGADRAGAGMVTLWSCRPGETSTELPDAQQGVFTHFLLKGLKGEAADERGMTTARTLAGYLGRNVEGWCRQNFKPIQNPWLAGDLEQDMDLVTRDAAARAQVSAIHFAAGSNYTENHDGLNLEMIWIPPGSFMMGSEDKLEEDNCRPAHRVTLDGFWIGKYELTEQQWLKVAGNRPSDDAGYRDEEDRKPQVGRRLQYPVAGVSWVEANDYCESLAAKTGRKYRLPTEAQWEYACRAGSPGRWCFGDDQARLVMYARFNTNEGIDEEAVGLLRPNAWGLHDMHGLLQEWCRDWYGPYSPQSQRNPTGPANGLEKVARSGHHHADFRSTTAASRRGARIDATVFMGFRLAREP